MVTLQPQVMVVDDDPSVLRSLELLLGDDCHVRACASAAEALAAVEHETFDVIVTDQRMPHMTGVELAAELTRRLAHPPYLLMLTGTPDFTPPQRPGVSPDLVMVLAKPVDPDRLIKLVTQIGRLSLARRQAERALP